MGERPVQAPPWRCRPQTRSHRDGRGDCGGIGLRFGPARLTATGTCRSPTHRRQGGGPRRFTNHGEWKRRPGLVLTSEVLVSEPSLVRLLVWGGLGLAA